MYLLEFLVVAVVFIVIFVYLFSDQLGLYEIYSNSTGFMGSSTFFIGTIVSIISLALAGAGMKEEEGMKSVYLVIPLFSLFYLFWCVNLILRSELFYKGAQTPRLNGALWLFLALLVCAYIIIYGNADLLPLVFIPFFWVIFCMYQWLVY